MSGINKIINNLKNSKGFLDFWIKLKIYFKKILRYKIFSKNMFLAQVSFKAMLEDKNLIFAGRHSEIHKYVIIRTYESKVTIGEYSQINPFTVIYGGSGVSIGKNVMIAPHCMIASGNHNLKQTNKPIRFAEDISKGPIIIEDNVWVGANCTITDGVRIGHDAVVGANSVVTKDVASFDIVAGCPAKIIGNRLNKL